MSSVLNAVYNNYLTTYTPKTLTQYDTHKKSELRSVYNAIVKLNKEAPWYLPTTNQETQAYAVDLKENARELHNSIAQLGGLDADALLSKKRAYTSDENIAGATYIGPDTFDEEIPTLEVEVRTLATSQENLGLFLADEPTGLAAGTYSFDVGINGMNYEFQFSIGEKETNRGVQERLARLIDNSGIGLKATLVESDGNTSLRLTSDATGSPAGRELLFSISDDHTSKLSGTVEHFGLDYVSRTPSNASFLVNGEERTTSSNHFTIGKLYDVELKGISPENTPTQIGLKTDTESLTDNITHLIGSYNDFIKATSQYIDSQSRSKRLVGEMSGIVSLYSEDLSAMGINTTEDGTLTVDRRTLHKVAENAEDITETFGLIKNFSSSLLRKSNQVALNPMNYVDKTVVAYKNPGRNFVSPYTTSAYSGMMFNGYC